MPFFNGCKQKPSSIKSTDKIYTCVCRRDRCKSAGGGGWGLPAGESSIWGPPPSRPGPQADLPSQPCSPPPRGTSQQAGPGLCPRPSQTVRTFGLGTLRTGSLPDSDRVTRPALPALKPTRQTLCPSASSKTLELWSCFLLTMQTWTVGGG